MPRFDCLAEHALLADLRHIELHLRRSMAFEYGHSLQARSALYRMSEVLAPAIERAQRKAEAARNSAEAARNSESSV